MRRLIIVFVTFAIASIHGVLLPPDPEMAALMDAKLDPCSDFYSYACGGWMKGNTLPDSRNRIDSSHMVVDNRIHQVITQLIEKEKPPVVTELWDSCMALDTIVLQSNKQLSNDLIRINRATTNTDLMVLAGEFARTGGSVFVKFNVGPDPFDTRRNTLLLSPEITLPAKYYSDDQFSKIQEAYMTYIDKIVEYVANPSHRKRKRSMAPSVANIVIRIEKQLADFQKQVEKILSPVTVKYALETWHFSFFLQKNGMQLIQNNVNMNGNLKIFAPVEYLNQIEDMIRTIPLEDLRIYINFRMAHSRAQWSSRDHERVWFDFFGAVLKKKKKHKTPDRARICRKSLLKYVPDLIGADFYNKAFNEQQEGMVREMFKLLQESMKERITKSTWLDKDTEMGPAKVKLSQVTTMIGKSQVARSYPFLSPTNYPANVYAILTYTFHQDMKKVGQPRNVEEWTVSAADSNAYYIREQNKLLLPAGVLQPPLFHGSKVHPSRNFGAIGSIMGHELIHGFDSKGSLYNGVGNKFPWWSPSTRHDYNELAKCYETQYSGFKARASRRGGLEAEKSVNGKLTLNENIADNGGVALAWDAYKKYMTTVNGDTHGIRAEDGDQMFFLAYAQTWCEKVRDNRMEYEIASNKCAPGQWRVNGVLMNNEDFAKAFYCNRYTPMNPDTKCVIW